MPPIGKTGVVNQIAVVEDDPDDKALIMKHLETYRAEHNVEFQVHEFSNGLVFLGDYKANYDILLMDIEMPHLNGMEVARKLRAVDESVCLIFITRMAKYAIEGYEVRALDFILKPVEYKNFSLKLERALDFRMRSAEKELKLDTLDGMHRVRVEDLYYVEVIDHTLYYYTANKIFEARGSITRLEGLLAPHGFARCSNSFLINLRHVDYMANGRVIVNGKSISIGRTWKKEFLQKLTDFVGDYNL